MPVQPEYEVIIIGGSYAGLSAALSLARARRNVLVIDSGKPCNAQTPQAHNFITNDGASPAAIIAKAKQEVLAYPTVRHVDASATAVTGLNEEFVVETASGSFMARKILFATGLKDIMPPIPGFSECWGISVLHCPYCHGYEVSGRPTALLGDEEGGYNMALALLNWTEDLVLLTNGDCLLSGEQKDDLSRHGVKLIEEKISSITQGGGQMSAVQFANGDELSINVLYARIPNEQHCNIPAQIGCRIDKKGYIVTDAELQTTVAGVYAAGDNVTAGRNLTLAVADGNKVAICMNNALIGEQIREQPAGN